ncbi:MAG: type II CRISPR RNA-guided endonuclease Cas9 [Anaerobutyricum sp.]|nr:type II CRISPR RNA-guided endonuclease Cas9 [Anaerobutyricum sp.]
MDTEYYLGLNLENDGLGWAATDKDYNIVRAHGKTLWGVRLFNNAENATERRSHRISRRRLDRRNQRLLLLQQLFEDEINRIDDGFFLRMKESQYVPEDKKDKDGNCPVLPYSLFVDADYTDKDYHKQFPTIYHLRKYLMETDTTPDLRLVYLALHHIMKYRGHFLLSGTIENIKKFSEPFEKLLFYVQCENLDFSLSVHKSDYSVIETILTDHSITGGDKKKKIIQFLKATTSCEKALIGLITGCRVKLSDIFGEKVPGDLKISFGDSSFDENADYIKDFLGESNFVIEYAKAVYDWAVLSVILGEHLSISEYKILIYEKHKEDLMYLKQLVKENLPKKIYKKIFVLTQDKLPNYPAYIGMTKINGKKQALAGKKCSKEELYHFLTKEIIAVLPKEKTAYLREEIEKGTFLPKQVTKENAILPHQIHLYELKKILENLRDKIPFLDEHADEIIKLFTFRIPYYVGPLNGVTRDGKTTNWMERSSSGNITPWNFEEKIDLIETAQRFVRRMTSKCIFLPSEDVLPKYSLLYSSFQVLNELNNLRVDNRPISVTLKQEIYLNLFEKQRQVTLSDVKKYLIDKKNFSTDVQISGIKSDFKHSLTAYHDFKNRIGECGLSSSSIENMILNITLFGDDKQMLKERLKILYPQLSDSQVTNIASLSYRGWGKLSRTFLESITVPNNETGEKWSIIQALWDTNENLKELLDDRYPFSREIKRKNQTIYGQEISHEMIDNLYISSARKRQIWQAVLIIKELVNVLGYYPKRIFLNFTNKSQKNKRTYSRKKELLTLYKNCGESERRLQETLKKISEEKLISKRIVLYFLQKGVCLLSGEQISLEKVEDSEEYDIMHIYPEEKIIDNSLDNCILVKRKYKTMLEGQYPLKEEIRCSMHKIWDVFHKEGFLSKEKYERLIRDTPLLPKELAATFQVKYVEMRRSTKAFSAILKQWIPEVEIMNVKPEIVGKFCHDFRITRMREINDYHYSRDAYLNIVVGNSYYIKFTNDPAAYLSRNPDFDYNLNTMYTNGENIVRNQETGWISGKNGSIKTVYRTLKNNNVLVTRRSYERKGAFFDSMILKKGKGQVPVKGSNARLSSIEKYGGYNNASSSYFMLVESKDRKGRLMRTIECVPLYLCGYMSDSEEKIRKYLETERNLSEAKIILPKIKMETLFIVDGFQMWLTGRSRNQLKFKGANQLILSGREERTVQYIDKYLKNIKVKERSMDVTKIFPVKEEDLIQLYDTFLSKLKNTIYGKRLKTQEKILEKNRGRFLILSNNDKCVLLNEVLHLFQCNSVCANLKLIGGPENSGVLVMSNNITKLKNISIIHQSPTGIYQKKIDLKR